MKKYWVKMGVVATIIVTTMNLHSGETIFHNGTECVVIDAL
jgi:hypothetical protein